MVEFLSTDDLEPFATISDEKAEAMVADATAMAVLAAPCLGVEPSTLTDVQVAAVKAVLRSAVLRWNEAGSGVLASETLGPYSQSLDTRQPRRGMFYPSEIEQLQNICKGETAGAFGVDTAPGCGPFAGHSEVCSLVFGALYCSCGSDLTGNLFPLYEV
jgi:hypothetical protein